MPKPPITVIEVGPRDGLQNDPSELDLAQKIDFINRLVDAGVTRLEAGAFVSPRAVPKMAQSAEIFEHFINDNVQADRKAKFIALALNETGVHRAIEARADEINFVLVASAGFGLRNQGMSPEQSLETLERAAPLMQKAGIPFSATISVAFGDPYEGDVPPQRVAALARRAARCDIAELGFGDTIGVATPYQVRDLMDHLGDLSKALPLRMHFHDTRGTALANIHSAMQAGVTRFDASLGGIGGCPFAPGASGNVATEDVVYMLERDGYDTGLDLDKLIAAAHWLAAQLGHEIYSSLSRAPKFK